MRGGTPKPTEKELREILLVTADALFAVGEEERGSNVARWAGEASAPFYRILAGMITHQNYTNAAIRAFVRDYMPSGSGIDAGTDIDLDQSTPGQIVLSSSYHMMNADGMYVGWVNFEVLITASLISDFELEIVFDPETVAAFDEESTECEDEMIEEMGLEAYEEEADHGGGAWFADWEGLSDHLGESYDYALRQRVTHPLNLERRKRGI